jgi:hypothetical protein
MQKRGEKKGKGLIKKYKVWDFLNYLFFISSTLAKDYLQWELDLGSNSKISQVHHHGK